MSAAGSTLNLAQNRGQETVVELEAIAYTSSAVGHSPDDVLEELLVKARAQNEIHGVTGVLLYHDGSFLQYFEGPPKGVAAVYERIRASTLHRNIIELMHEPVPRRAFSAWLMGFTQAPESELLQLANASWKARVTQEDRSAIESDGVQLLFDFWQRYSREHSANLK